MYLSKLWNVFEDESAVGGCVNQAEGLPTRQLVVAKARKFPNYHKEKINKYKYKYIYKYKYK